MSLLSVVLFDQIVTPNGHVDGDSLITPHDMGFVTNWFLTIDTEAIETVGTANNPGMPTLVWYIAQPPTTRLVPHGPVVFSQGPSEVPQGPFVVGPYQFKLSGIAARIIESLPDMVNNSGVFPDGTTSRVVVTLYYFKDTGLLASN